MITIILPKYTAEDIATGNQRAINTSGILIQKPYKGLHCHSLCTSKHLRFYYRHNKQGM